VQPINRTWNRSEYAVALVVPAFAANLTGRASAIEGDTPDSHPLAFASMEVASPATTAYGPSAKCPHAVVRMVETADQIHAR
jgi:hypothetical protein